MTLYKRIYRMAKKREMSLSDFAVALAFGKNAIQKWDNESPAFIRVNYLADYIEVDARYLLKGEPTSYKGPENHKELLKYYDEFTYEQQDYFEILLHSFSKYNKDWQVETAIEVKEKMLKNEMSMDEIMSYTGLDEETLTKSKKGVKTKPLKRENPLKEALLKKNVSPMSSDDKLVERIIEAANSKSMTLNDIESKLGFVKDTIQTWKSVNTSWQKLIMVADLLEEDGRQLLKGEPTSYDYPVEQKKYLEIYDQLTPEQQTAFKSMVREQYKVIQKAKKAKALEIAEKMLNCNKSIEEVINYTDLDEETIKKLQEDLTKSNNELNE